MPDGGRRGFSGVRSSDRLPESRGKRRPVFSELSGGARRSGRRRRRSFRKFNQNNVVANLTDGFPGNDDVFFSAQDAAEFGRTRYNQRDNPSGDTVEIYVCRTAQGTAAADIDNFFLLQIDQTNEKVLFFQYMID